jgi:hypothetical protein
VIEVLPCAFVEVMESMPAIVENCFSSGVATAEAMVSGLAPGTFAETRTVGKSTFGRSLTGRSRYPAIPTNRMESMTRVVMTGRRMESSEIFILKIPNYKSQITNNIKAPNIIY